MQRTSSSRLQLTLGTGAFALCFAVFGTMSALMPILTKQMHLTAVQKSVAVALPVLLGSLGRIPLGILADRFGGRVVFSCVMVMSIIPAFLMGTANDYRHLLFYGLFIGIALANFSVGVSFVNGWYSAQRQGFALGVYGAGNIGQSLAGGGGTVMLARFRSESRESENLITLCADKGLQKAARLRNCYRTPHLRHRESLRVDMKSRAVHLNRTRAPLRIVRENIRVCSHPCRKMHRLLLSWCSFAQNGPIPWRTLRKNSAATSIPKVGARK